MKAPPIKSHKHGPEHKIREDIIRKLRFLGWYVKIIHGSMYQSGFPDLFACHSKYGVKLIEVKNKDAYHFTAAQLDEFPKLVANGASVYVLTSADDSEINKLRGGSNWYWYLNTMKGWIKK